MATITNIPDCQVETNAVQQLADNPNESGLTANELKTTFDQDATNLKNWINDDADGLLKKINDNFSALNTDSTALSSEIGTLSNLNTTSKSNVVSAINEVNTNMKTNNLLWSGGYYMTAGHTIDLSATPISSQKNGIVLVWSYYDNGSAQNINMTTTFIPKKFVENFSGGGVTTLMSGVSTAYFAAKVVYITDTTIVGSNANTDTGTSNSGIKFYNNKYVLRAVIGV